MARYDIGAVGTDNFVADILDRAGAKAFAASRRTRQRFQNPALDVEALIAKIENGGLQDTTNILCSYQSLQ